MPRAVICALAVCAGFSYSAQAQKPVPLPGSLRQAATQPQVAALAITAQRTDAGSRLSGDLQRLYQVGLANRSLAASAASQTFPQLRFGKSGTSVLVRIMAQNVTALLPSLLSKGFVTLASFPNLHFVEGLLPVSQLAPGSQGIAALSAQGLLGVIPSYRPLLRVGATTSQGDVTMEAARTRALQPRNLDGKGVRVGVISDSFNSLNGAATDIATGDLPATGVQVLLDDGTTDEGRAMCQIVHDLAPARRWRSVRLM
ncbi:hypothetical protein [Hymenobacter sp. BRD67]|uniref:hypothetical protein n=1 Tax=Hymenobacter sp. BRD67 TaxID=2675877 RepID=UPI001563F6EA|nr:hypothetical protein [Hymenobacter sp. BRD67]QKG53632.1 hypothetical protein GKZ67_14775 [Hymenobacter sp. BRD67]